MKPTPAGGRFRLIDGVIVAAIALLTLKVLGFLSPHPEAASSSAAAAPTFGRVLSYARTNFELPEPTTTGSIDRKGEPAPAAPASAAPASAPIARPGPAVPATEQLIMDRLSERREELQQRARDVDGRQKLLEDQERRLDERIGRLQAVEDARKTGPGSRSEAEAAAMKNLVVMYETMKPKEAARVFERLPQDVLVSVVTLMNSRKMSEVLAAMSPESAERLTVALAKRGKGPGGAEDKVSSAGLPAGELPAIEPPAFTQVR